jgi:hypothetical protein
MSAPRLPQGRADESWLQIGQPDVIGPWVRADRNGVAALVVRAIDQETAHAGRAHFAERDLLRAVCSVVAAASGEFRHAAIEPRAGRADNRA